MRALERGEAQGVGLGGWRHAQTNQVQVPGATRHTVNMNNVHMHMFMFMCM